LTRVKPKKKRHQKPGDTTTGRNKELLLAGPQQQAIYLKNLQALRQHYPTLAAQLEMTMPGRYQLVYTANNKLPTLFDKAENFTYYRPDDPLGDVRGQLEALGLKNTRMAIFLGFGLGYELAYYIRNLAVKQNTSFILVIEKDLEIFKTALQVADYSTLFANNKISFMVGMPEDKLYYEMRTYLADNSRFMFLKTTKPVYHSSSLKLNKTYYLNALKHFREGGKDQVLHFGNDPNDSLIGVKNMLANLDEIAYNPGINRLYNSFKGKPAVIISTGPSLNKNIHLLKGLEEKALLIAVDTSLKVMMAKGLKPHMVTSLERTITVKKLMEGFNETEVKDVFYAACPVIDPEVYQAYPGPRIIVYRNFDHFKWLNIDRGILDVKKSSANMAFKIAEALGCDPIILIGQDLAFGNDGFTHAEGAASGNKQAKYSELNSFEVKGNYSETVRTTEMWYNFLKGYEIDIATYKGRCINSTEGGAYIQGTSIMSFEEAIDNYCSAPFVPLDIIRARLATYTYDDIENDLTTLKELIDATSSDFRKIKELCNTGKELYEHHKANLISLLAEKNGSKLSSGDINKLFNTILEPKTEIIEQYNHTYQLFFMHVLQSFSIKFEMEQTTIIEKYDNRDLAVAEIALRHSEWYTVVGGLATKMLELLNMADEKLADLAANRKVAANR
jgi:hypothetical protein